MAYEPEVMTLPLVMERQLHVRRVLPVIHICTAIFEP
jgi:hypothetical protein